MSEPTEEGTAQGERDPFTWMPPDANAMQAGGTAACAAGGGVIAGSLGSTVAVAPFAVTSLLPQSAAQTVAAIAGTGADPDTGVLGLGLVFLGVALNVVSLGMRLAARARARAASARKRASLY